MELHHVMLALYCFLHLIHPTLDDFLVLQDKGVNSWALLASAKQQRSVWWLPAIPLHRASNIQYKNMLSSFRLLEMVGMQCKIVLCVARKRRLNYLTMWKAHQMNSFAPSYQMEVPIK